MIIIIIILRIIIVRGKKSRKEQNVDFVATRMSLSPMLVVDIDVSCHENSAKTSIALLP